MLLPSHSGIFDPVVKNFGRTSQPIVFMDRDGIRGFASHLELEIVELLGGDPLSIPLEQASCGVTAARCELGKLGQSVAVLRKP
jgi:hypothetical protein